jgi:AraC family transcriptional regulator, regulatory protein of adaptative response / methylated-DNA-[protein]-cysteine methyltransferase
MLSSPYTLLLKSRDSNAKFESVTQDVISYGQAPTPFGHGILGWTDEGIIMLHLQQFPATDPRDLLTKRYPGRLLRQSDCKAQEQIQKIFVAPPRFNLSLVLRGSPFQLSVWQALNEIPFGEVRTYGELANMLGQPNAARAVGTAVGANPLAFLIPCHRIVRTDGTTGQYRWGAERKIQILDWEAQALAKDRRQA